MPLTFTEADFADTNAESQGKGLKFTEADFAEPAAAPDIGAFLPRWKSPTLNLEQGPSPASATIPSALAGPSPVEPLDPFEDLMRPATSYLPPGAHKALRTGLQYATTPELKLVELASELTGAKKTGEITKGIEDSITDLEEFFTSPVGAASLFAGGLTAAGQKAVALAFATKMATDVPEIATQLGAEIGKPEDERDYRKIAQLASEGAQAVGFAGLGGAHVAGRPLAGKLGAYPTSAPVTIPGIREARIGQYPEPIGPQPPLASPDEQPIIPNPSLPSRAKKVRVEVPEAGEPPSGLNVIQEIRQNNLRTAPSIQEHFRRTGGRVPDNEEAAQLRDQAFPEDVTERLISEGEGRQRVVNELNALNRLPNKRAADWKRIGQLEEQLRGVTRQPPSDEPPPPPPDEGGTPTPKPPPPPTPIQPKGPNAIQIQKANAPVSNVPAQPVQGQGQVPAPQGAQGIRRGPPPEPPQAQPPVLKPTPRPPAPTAPTPGEPELLGRPVSAWKQIATAQRIALLDPANQTRLANSLGLPLDQRTPHQIATRLKQRIAEVEAAAAAKAKPAEPVAPTESAADLQQELDTELEQEPTVAAPTPAAPVKPTPPETPTTEPAPTTPQAPKPQTPLERLKALEASIKKEQEAAVAALTPTEPAPTAAPVAPAATPTEPTPTAPTPEPPSAKPLTKTQQAAHQSATRNADFLIGVAEKYSSATLPQRLKGKVEGAMIAMRNAAAKLGMEVPSQGMWFSPETNAELARNVKDKLEGIKPETKPTGTQPPIEERGPQGGNISTFGLLDPAWIKPIIRGAGATIRDTVGALYGPSDAPMPERMRGFIGGVAGQTFPRTTKAHRTTGEKGAKFISSRSAGAIQGTTFAHDVLDGTGADNLQVGAAVMEGNFRSVKRGFTEAAAEAQRRGDTAEAARLALESRKVATAVGQGSIWPNEAAYQAYLQSPEFRAAAPKYARLWTSDVDPIFRRAADIDPTENLETRGEQHGLRANLNWARVDPAEPGRTGVFIRDADGVLRPSNIVAPNAPSGASRRGVLSNVLHRKSPFARRATGQAEAYILDLTSAMQNTFGRQLEIANRKFFDDALVENGHAVIGRPGEIHELHGEPTRAFEIKRTTIVRETDGTTRRIPVNQNIYVRESLAPEYEAGLNIASLGPNSTKLAKINKGLNTLVLSGFTDAAIHGTNQAMTMLGSPGTMQGYFKELIASGFMRADFIPTIGRMVQKTLHENSKQMLKLAEMSAWREGVPDPHYMEWGRNLKPAQLANPMNWSRGFIHWLDGAGRLVLDDMFTNLTKTYSHIPDTPTNRREFVNRLGQYAKRAQGPIIRFLRDINAAPFVTAGRQMSLNTARLATFQPGLQTGSLWTRGQLMTMSAAKLVGTVLFAGAAGYALTGQFGKPGEIILPIRDREGRRLRINVFELLGYGRGWRGTGMRAVAQGIIQRQPLRMIADNASKDIGNAWTRPFVGPPLQFEEIARTGQPFGFGQRGYLSRPGRTGIGQFGENVKAAALHTVPLASTISEGLRPGTTALDVAQKQFPRIVPTPERNALSQIRELGRVYKQREGIGYAPRSLERSIYEPLQSALVQNNAPLIRDEVQRLLEQEKTPEKKEKRLKEIQSELWPFSRTGNLHLKAQATDLDHEADFYNSLKPQEKVLYQQALKDKVRSYGRLLLALGVKDARYPPVQDAYKWVLQP